MDASAATIEFSANGFSSISADRMAWAEERLGPRPGKWDGYSEIADSETRQKVWTKVGYIHGLSAEAGRNIVSIGQTLQEMKEVLPHGQFMACVKAEFTWSRQWSNQLMLIAKRFSNDNSSCHLPSSAKVLGLLASAGADDATVQQAADEQWTVAETKQKLRRFSGPRQAQSVEVLALSLIRKGELPRIREALALAEKAQVVTAQQVMDEQRLRDLGKQRIIAGTEADFHRMKDGTWIRMPHSGRVEMSDVSDVTNAFDGLFVPLQQIEADPEETENGERSVPLLGAMPAERAAQILGISINTVKQYVAPSFIAKRGYYTKNNIKLTRGSKGMVCLTKIND